MGTVPRVLRSLRTAKIAKASNNVPPMYFNVNNRTWTKSNKMNEYVQSRNITNFEAMQGMKELLHSMDRGSIIKNALTLYHCIDGQKNQHSMNVLLRIFALYEPQKILSISDDIMSLNPFHLK